MAYMPGGENDPRPVGPSARFTKLPHGMVDVWFREIVRRYGASHALLLVAIARETLGYQQRMREVGTARLANLMGMSKTNVCELLSDLEAVGAVVRERRPGRKTLLGVVPDWVPSEEAFARGEEARRERLARKNPDARARAGLSAAADTSKKTDLSATADRLGVSHSSTVDADDPTAAADTSYIERKGTPGRRALERKEPSASTGDPRKKDSGGGPGLGGAGGSVGERERNPSPPPLEYSKAENVGGVERSEESKNLQTRGSQDPPSPRDGEARSAGEGEPGYTDLMRNVEAIPERELTDEARALGDALLEKLFRLQRGKARRLALRCINSGDVEKLGNTTGELEDDLKGRKVGNAFAYLCKALHPLSETADGSQTNSEAETVLETFLAAYGAVRGMYSLRGSAGRVQQYGVGSPRTTDSFFKEFKLSPEEEAEFQQRQAGGEKGREAAGDRPGDAAAARRSTEDLIERL